MLAINPGISNFVRRARGAAVGPQNLEAELQERGQADFDISQQRTRTATRQIQGAVDQVGLSDAVSKAGARADASFNVAEGVLGRRQEALGLQKSRRQKTAQGRHLSLGREIAKDDAEGDVRRGFSDRATEAARAGVGIEDELRNVETDALTGLANAEGQEKIRAAQAKANKKSARNSTIGTAVGFGLSLLALSDENAKYSKRSALDDGSLLDKLKKVRVDKWKYNGEEQDHIGPYAQEFNEAFGVGTAHKKMISLVDAVGVAMGAIKELNEKVEAHG
jgi:hypothetical protein